MKLGDMASLQDGVWVRPRLVPTTRGPNQGTVVFFPGCWIELLLLCTGRCKRTLETFLQQWKTGMCNAEFYLCLGRHILHDWTQGCGWFSNKAEQRQGFVTCSLPFIPSTNPPISSVWAWCQLNGLSLLLKRGKGMEMKIHPYAAR